MLSEVIDVLVFANKWMENGAFLNLCPTREVYYVIYLAIKITNMSPLRYFLLKLFIFISKVSSNC